MKDGKLVAKRTLLSGGETAGPVRPTENPQADASRSPASERSDYGTPLRDT